MSAAKIKALKDSGPESAVNMVNVFLAKNSRQKCGPEHAEL